MEKKHCCSQGCMNQALIQVISTLNRSTHIFGSLEKMQKDQTYEWEDWFCEKCFLKLENAQELKKKLNENKKWMRF